MAIEIGEKTLSANGCSRHVLQKDGGDLTLRTTVQTTLAWQPSSYDPDCNTLDFCFRPTAELLAWVLELEAEVQRLVSEDSEKFFGQAVAPGIIKKRFQSCLKTSQKGTEHLQMQRQIREHQVLGQAQGSIKEAVWNSDDFYLFVVAAKAVWVNDAGWGIAYDLQHLQIFAAECPF